MPKKSSNQNPNLEANIKLFMRSRNKVFYDGSITTLTSVNETGEFDVLETHANFITMVKDLSKELLNLAFCMVSGVLFLMAVLQQLQRSFQLE